MRLILGTSIYIFINRSGTKHILLCLVVQGFHTYFFHNFPSHLKTLRPCMSRSSVLQTVDTCFVIPEVLLPLMKQTARMQQLEGLKMNFTWISALILWRTPHRSRIGEQVITDIIGYCRFKLFVPAIPFTKLRRLPIPPRPSPECHKTPQMSGALLRLHQIPMWEV